MATRKHQKPVVAIIGGGVSGAGVAFHLAQSGMLGPNQLFVFEPRERLGPGLAYDTLDPAHRINVPASRMSLMPDDMEQFQRWIVANNAVSGDDDAMASDGNLFPRRSLFGTYVNAMVQPFVDSGEVVHVMERVADVRRRSGRWLLSGESGRQIEADILVVATSHPSPSAPKALVDVLKDHPRFVADPTDPDALDAIRSSDRVLIVGNGLTSSDIIASLALRGHHGAITAISRRGLRSRGHARMAQDLYGDFVSVPARTALALLQRIRQAILSAEGEGRSWHAVIDQVRFQGGEVWRALPLAERRRVVRHLRPFWDVHRFRIAPQVEDASEQALRAGRLTVLAASVEAVRSDGVEIECRLRLSRSGERIERRFEAVVVTTGPSHGGIIDSQPWIRQLADAGYLSLDGTGLGLSCDNASRALGSSGEIAPSLYISGPLARGTFGELMGLPQVSEHAVLVAAEIGDALGVDQSGPLSVSVA
ncbi:FAD/NAD(P)-binding protein [Rhizobium tubonense]|uniref:Hydroxyacylglutathione hydrolase n=1 Tax=Rhizobium tubonense TaxID=484088 RepID=A0A2W4CJZ0_9HYPH|nr:FAD/NAD(P)-binding protein [Rhizobium tubonense]PZM13202.1 hydroxyacylglutathione hydrolase [Rhizobium tubonense]